MSGRLVGEVVEWLQTPVAADLTAAERCVLFVVAERANEQTREMWHHRVDECHLVDRIASAVGVSRDGLKKVFQRLARRGLEVRVAISVTKAGKPVFAHEGRSMRFRLPEFPASVSLPQRGDGGPFSEGSDPVDNPVNSDVNDLREEDKRGDGSTSSEPKRGYSGAQEGGLEYPPSPSSSPSKDLPSKTPHGSVSQPDVEGEAAGRREPSADLDYPTAFKIMNQVLLRMPDYTEVVKAEAAAKGRDSPRGEALTIAVARLALADYPHLAPERRTA